MISKSQVIKYFDRKFNESFFEEIKNFMSEQTNKIKKLDSTVALLQEHVKELKLIEQWTVII